ncbi:MAG: phospho-sugar mutase [Alicyclobacillus herbarius]|uniref:phospho-sugar mutase n=1 Tax=Alicyclobacillus herbarius TaxID=122960 RepID=UPI0023566442|nr:phospho-sugar mutase [Alicyclobacillus herbarius]MCL6632077.1 phospho-sugar mutase [Alicyclobacillus herbarius]
MNEQEEYQKWLSQPGLPKDLHEELESIKGDKEAIEARFGGSLEFGTAGLRAVMGAGPNRLNIYTVRKASFAFAKYLLEHEPNAAERGVVIGYDCRHMSYEFARETGLTMAAMGIRAYVSPYLCPTPEVSFAIRHLQTAGGVTITASHNPPEYNGYKAYGPDGCQFLPDATEKIRAIAAKHQDVFHIPTLPLDEATRRGLFQWTSPEVRGAYLESVVREVKFPSLTAEQRLALSIVYTPLHGSGNIPVRNALQAAGYGQVHVVQEQAEPNGDFPTVKSPNPEEPEALELGIRVAREIQADLVLGTDPDADRVGIAVRDENGSYTLLTGNQVGALLADFILSRRKAEGRLPKNGIVFKTVVTSELGQAVADAYGIALENTLTGFKYIGSGITEYERTGKHTFLLGYEESYGYLVSPIVRDKDAVQTCLAIAEMAAFHKSQGRTLHDALDDLFKRFGFYKEELVSVKITGEDASERREAILDDLRKNTPIVENLRLVAIEDYSAQRRVKVGGDGKPLGEAEPLHLPKSDVLKYWYEGGSWMAIRPSGTEPKVKAYLAARGKDKQECEEKIRRMRTVIEKRVT